MIRARHFLCYLVCEWRLSDPVLVVSFKIGSVRGRSHCPSCAGSHLTAIITQFHQWLNRGVSLFHDLHSFCHSLNGNGTASVMPV